jgi:hypothetical protein
LVQFPEPYGTPELRVGPTRMFGFDDNDRNRIVSRGQQETNPIRKRDGSYHTIELEAFAHSAKCFAVRMTLG